MGETGDRYARWVGMWQEAVRACPTAVGLVELSTTRFVELSPAAAELLATTPEAGAGLSYLAFADRPRETALAFRLVRLRMLDGTQARRRFRRLDGSTVDVQMTSWAVRSAAGPDLGLWIACDGGPHSAALLSAHGAGDPGARLTLDNHWRITAVTAANGELVLGRPAAELHSASLLDLAHPDDLSFLLLAFARVTTGAGGAVQVRMRHSDGGWQTVRAAPEELSGGASPFALTVAAGERWETLAVGGGTTRLAGDLRRIAALIEGAGSLAALVDTADAVGLPPTADLSPRQWEVVSRLVRGDRVGTIAAEMELSESTVRNHLSAIFAKVGVHSQQELLALWRGASRDRPPTR
ncbi:MAG TPA: LuxR C-terminal-related transcriptional regulator [Candidatus Angelobacter sp.]|nr:LuxR C-terminal-related transcriptional regulator [Candidatus Angelobacter sp.]